MTEEMTEKNEVEKNEVEKNEVEKNEEIKTEEVKNEEETKAPSKAEPMSEVKLKEIQLRYQDMMEAIERWCEASDFCASFVADFWAFDMEKIQSDAEDVTVPEACGLIAFGDKESLLISIDTLKEAIEKNVDKDGFVNLL